MVGQIGTRFAEAALLAGFASVHAIPMKARHETIGALSLYATRAGRLDEHSPRLAGLLAEVASIAILQQRMIETASLLNEQLQRALNSRVVIEQAKGMIAIRYAVSIDAAFALLRSHARGHNYQLSTLAQAVVANTDDLPRHSRPDPIRLR